MGATFIQEGIIYRPGTLAANCPSGTNAGPELTDLAGRH